MTLISNNCAGGAILHSLGMEFRTPTILLQILPEQYPKFCEHFAEYMQKDLVEVKASDLDHWQEIWLNKMFGGVPDMPFGLLGDILVCFQHYETFEEAKKKWNERRARIDFSDVSFLMHARGEEYRGLIDFFDKMDDICDIIDMMKIWDRDFGNDEDEQNVLAGDPERFGK